MTKPKPNAELAYRVLDQIDAHPESWNQSTWGCGTVACFAGWAVQLSGGIIDPEGYDSNVIDGPPDLVGHTVEVAARRVLGADVWIERPDNEMEWLFAARNTREDLGRLVAEIFGPRPAPTVVTCSCCLTPFDPADPAFDGRAQYRSTPWCRWCVDLCHESTDAAHSCMVCTEPAPGGAA